MSYKNEEFGRVNYKPEEARQNRKTAEEKLAAVQNRRKIEDLKLAKMLNINVEDLR